jgi:hypothetical protein
MSKYFSYLLCVEDMSTTKFLFYEKLLKMINQLYVNEIPLHIRSRTRPIDMTRPGGPVQMGYVVLLSWATSPGATGLGLTVLCRYVARPVTPISVA